MVTVVTYNIFSGIQVVGYNYIPMEDKAYITLSMIRIVKNDMFKTSGESEHQAKSDK